MSTRQAINNQTKYDYIFSHMIRDKKLATSDRQIQSGYLDVDFGHFSVTYL